jgi:hypothetical protein
MTDEISTSRRRWLTLLVGSTTAAAVVVPLATVSPAPAASEAAPIDGGTP